MEEPACANGVATAQMVKPDSRLNQSLIETFERAVGDPPQIFPGFVGVVEPSRVKKNEALLKKIFGWHVFNLLIFLELMLDEVDTIADLGFEINLFLWRTTLGLHSPVPPV